MTTEKLKPIFDMIAVYDATPGRQGDAACLRVLVGEISLRDTEIERQADELREAVRLLEECAETLAYEFGEGGEPEQQIRKFLARISRNEATGRE